MLINKLITSIILVIVSQSIVAQTALAPKIQFDYELRLKVDFKQREAFLKKNGEEPASYEKALKFISGSIHAANITDVLFYKGDTYQINSTGTLTSVLSVALQDQKLVRFSFGNVTKDGLSTLNYVERRGDTDRLEAKLDAKAGKVKFYKGKVEESAAPIVGNLQDMLNVMYMYVGRKSPPPSQATYNVTDSRSVKQYRLNKAELWDFPFNGTKVKAYRYFKSVTKDDSTTLEIWFSEKDNIPLRLVIGLGERYGATIQADLKTIPAL